MVDDELLGGIKGLNPRWCVKAGNMDRNQYKSYSEMVKPTSISILVAIKCEFFELLCDFQLDQSNAFQNTRTVDDAQGDKNQPMLEGLPEFYCRQPPGFVKYNKKGKPLVCRIKCGMQGRIDATRLHSDRKMKLLEKAMFHSGN